MLTFEPGANFATGVALWRMATANGAPEFHLLASEVSTPLHYMPDRRHRFYFSTLWNIGSRISDVLYPHARPLVTVGPRPIVRILSEKVRNRHARPPKDAVRQVQLTDPAYISQLRVPRTMACTFRCR